MRGRPPKKETTHRMDHHKQLMEEKKRLDELNKHVSQWFEIRGDKIVSVCDKADGCEYSSFVMKFDPTKVKCKNFLEKNKDLIKRKF